jgi:CDP-diacylglycerol--glycerol-3-phosphate 3-phosphatidyltransferase
LYSIDLEAVNENGRVVLWNDKAMATFLRYQQLRTVPNVVTLVRPIGMLPFGLLSAQAQQPDAVGARVGTVLLYAVIVGSDTLDGWLARRLHQESAFGQVLDHVCDVLFILITLGTFAARHLVPWWLPAAIAWAFTLYVVDSWRRTAGQSQRRLLGSRLGHLGGVLYYIAVGVVIGHLCTDGRWFPPHLLQGWYLSLALLALLSGTERLYYLVYSFISVAPGAPAEENIPQSGR